MGIDGPKAKLTGQGNHELARFRESGELTPDFVPKLSIILKVFLANLGQTYPHSGSLDDVSAREGRA